MKPLFLAAFAALGAVALSAAAPTAAYADRIGEVEAARANARAGGPLSSHDIELLERWGALSGTPPGWRRGYGWRGYDESSHKRRWKRRH